ncbi:MAG: alpha/beta hydrolase [Rudaea sp.]
MTSHTLTPEEIERGYDNRAAVPEHPYWFEQFAARTREAVEALRPALDVRYGPGAKETLDLYVPKANARGTLLFIHGGYWRGLDKSEHGFVAPVFVDEGYAVAVVNYDLCPTVTIATIVDECRRAVAWLVREGPARGAPGPLVIGGHSAGGHLAAMMFATDWTAQGFAPAPIAGGFSLSGVHDLEPLLQFSGNADFRLDGPEARRLSPVHLRPATDAPLVLAVGANETSEFVRQTDMLWDAWPHNRPPGATGPVHVAERHHFNVVLDFTERDSALTQAVLRLFPGRALR